jgi:hypothetical protein
MIDSENPAVEPVDNELVDEVVERFQRAIGGGAGHGAPLTGTGAARRQRQAGAATTAPAKSHLTFPS